MGSFEKQVKERAKELKTLFKKGVKVVGESCKKGWNKVKHLRKCCERRLSNRDFRFFVPLSVISLSCIEAFMDILMGMIDSCSLSLIFEMRGGLGAVNRITRRYTKIPIIPCKPPHFKLRTV
nr:hypothetical protein BC332_19273 [Ipomoea batatas]